MYKVNIHRADAHWAGFPIFWCAVACLTYLDNPMHDVWDSLTTYQVWSFNSNDLFYAFLLSRILIKINTVLLVWCSSIYGGSQKYVTANEVQQNCPCILIQTKGLGFKHEIKKKGYYVDIKKSTAVYSSNQMNFWCIRWYEYQKKKQHNTNVWSPLSFKWHWSYGWVPSNDSKDLSDQLNIYMSRVVVYLQAPNDNEP